MLYYMNMSKKRRSGLKILIWVILIGGLVSVGLLALFVASIPLIVTHIDYPELTIDLSTNLSPKASSLFNNKTITAKFKVKSDVNGGFRITAKGNIFDWPYTLSSVADYSLSDLSAKSEFRLSLDGTEWRIDGTVEATPSTWSAKAGIPSFTVSETDPVLAPLLAKLVPPAISNLVFSGTIGLDATAGKTKKVPVTAWSARAKLARVDADCEIGGKSVSIRKFSSSFGADGIADRTTIHPMYPRIASVNYDRFSVADFSASIRMTETALLITEAGAGFCGGEIKLYSLFLDPAKLTTGFTLFLDDIDSNEIFNHLEGFSGTASGRLHGKIPVFLKDGKTLRLRNSYLYSIPGEKGTLKLDQADPIVENLAIGGVDEDTIDNLSKALRNLEYSALKFDLKRDPDGGLALAMSISGNATHGSITVPVNVSVTLHGDIEQLINTGMKLSK